MYSYMSTNASTCQDIANQLCKASMYSARAAILLVSSDGRANTGLCLMARLRLRCGRTTP
ncbi:hypothetical protein V8C42DRAFT_121428 [Trichoderma barbatum]